MGKITFANDYKTEEEIFKNKNNRLYVVPIGIASNPYMPEFIKKNFPSIYQQYIQLIMGPQGQSLEFMTIDQADFSYSLLLITAIDENSIDINLLLDTLEKIIKFKQPENIYFHVSWIRQLENFSVELFEYEIYDYVTKITPKKDIKFCFVYEPESNIGE